MRTKRVTETWEYYRDNCSGFKEPMRKRFRELDEYVAELEELCAELYMNLRNRETVMELMGIPPSKEQRDGDEIIDHRMDELGIPRGQ